MRVLSLDLCCQKRPMDPQSDPLVREEAEAVARLLEWAEKGRFGYVRSPALEVENAANPAEERRRAVQAILDRAAVSVEVDENVVRRAGGLHRRGFSPMDAYHVALAEAAGAEALVTTDRRLRRRALAAAGSLAVRVAFPGEIV